MGKYILLNNYDCGILDCNRRFLYQYKDDAIYDISITYLHRSTAASNQKNNMEKTVDEQMLSEVMEISKRIWAEKDGRVTPMILESELLSLEECNDGEGNKVKAFGVVIDDDEVFSISYIQSVCNEYWSISEEIMIAEDYYDCIEENELHLCAVCDTPHRKEKMFPIEADSDVLACQDCIEDSRVVKCNCMHHDKDDYYIRREDAAYVNDEDEEYLCEAYDDDGGLMDFEDDDDLEDYYEDLTDRD